MTHNALDLIILTLLRKNEVTTIRILSLTLGGSVLATVNAHSNAVPAGFIMSLKGLRSSKA